MGKSRANDNKTIFTAGDDLDAALNIADDAARTADRQLGVKAIEAIWTCIDSATPGRPFSPNGNKR